MEDYPGEWMTAPTDSERNPENVIFVTGRSDVAKFKTNPRYSIRVDITLEYSPTSAGMPDEKNAELLKEVTDRLVDVFHKDPVAVLTGIYTGDGERNWIFYTTSTNIFQKKINLALADLPTLPLHITAENDPDWHEYTEMLTTLQ